MRRIVAGAVCAAMLGGCMSYRTSEHIAQVGGYTFAVGLPIGVVSLVMAADQVGDASANGFLVGLLVAPVGLLLGAVGLIGMAVNDEPSEQPVVAPERWQPAPATRSVDDGGATVRRRAVELTHEAVAASHAGDCATVKRLGASVRALDRKVYASVFAIEPDLQRCLTDAAPVTAPVENDGISGSQSTTTTR
jgi:hypothetical protein